MLSLELLSDKESGMAWVCTSGCPSRTYVRQKLFNENWFKSGRQCHNSCTSMLICHSAYSACHKTTRFLQKIQYYLRHTFVILSQKHCISAAQTLRCCMNPLSRFHHSFVMSHTSPVRMLVPSTCYHPSSCLTTSWEWHESAHQDDRPEHVWDRNSQTKTALNLGGNATIFNNSCTSLLICHSAYSACQKPQDFCRK